MRVLICGAGRVGQGIARRLAAEKHSITIIDENPRLVDKVSTELDVRGVAGNAAYPDVLRSAGAEECEMIIAVTYHDEVNMVICQVAHSLYQVPTKIARVRAAAYLEKSAGDLFAREGLPIDVVISPEIAVGDAILQRIRTPGALTSVSFAKDRVKLVGFSMDEESPIKDTALEQLHDIFPDLEARVVGIGRGKTLFAPRSKDRLLGDDRVYLSVEKEHASRLSRILNRKDEDLRHIIIVGGGNIGTYLASRIERETNIKVRLIETDPARAERAVMQLRRTIVIQGDGLSADILDEAGVSGADFLIALTNDDKTNLLLSNLAKRLGAERVLALVNSPELSQLSRDLKVDVILDPRALTVSQILQRMRRGRIINLHSFENGEAEATEGVVLERSPLIGSALGYDDMPEGITAAAIVREDEILFPDPAIKVRAQDRVILFYEQEMTRKVEQYFRVSQEFF